MKHRKSTGNTDTLVNDEVYRALLNMHPVDYRLFMEYRVSKCNRKC